MERQSLDLLGSWRDMGRDPHPRRLQAGEEGGDGGLPIGRPANQGSELIGQDRPAGRCPHRKAVLAGQLANRGEPLEPVLPVGDDGAVVTDPRRDDVDVVVLTVGVPDKDIGSVVVAERREVAACDFVPLVVREGFAGAKGEDGVEDRLPEPVAGDLAHLVGDLRRALVRAEGAADQKPLVWVEDVAKGTLEVAPLDDLVDQETSPRSWRRT